MLPGLDKSRTRVAEALDAVWIGTANYAYVHAFVCKALGSDRVSQRQQYSDGGISLKHIESKIYYCCCCCGYRVQIECRPPFRDREDDNDRPAYLISSQAIPFATPIYIIGSQNK